MIDYINRQIRLKPISFDDMELLQTHLVENDDEAFKEQVCLLMGIQYEPANESARASQVDA